MCQQQEYEIGSGSEGRAAEDEEEDSYEDSDFEVTFFTVHLLPYGQVRDVACCRAGRNSVTHVGIYSAFFSKQDEVGQARWPGGSQTTTAVPLSDDSRTTGLVPGRSGLSGQPESAAFPTARPKFRCVKCNCHLTNRLRFCPPCWQVSLSSLVL